MATLRELLEEAGAHAMRLRSGEPRRIVELQVRPAGIEVCVVGQRENMHFIGFDVIEQVKSNVLVKAIDDMVASIEAHDTIHEHGQTRPRWR